MIEALVRDLRFGVRQLRRNPLFALVVVLTLALGIGANAAIFTLLDQILLRDLPVRDPQALMVLSDTGITSGSVHSNSDILAPLSYPMYQDIAAGSGDVLSGVLAYCEASLDVGNAGQTEEARGLMVSGNYFDVLGLQPAAGRLFSQADDRTPGGHPVVVLGFSYFQKHFGGEAGTVGRTILVNGQPMTVVGVAPRGFSGLEVGRGQDLYLPLMMVDTALPTFKGPLPNRRFYWLTLFARLQKGVGFEAARARLQVVYRQAIQEELKAFSGKSASFQARFLQKTLQILPGERGASDLRARSRITLLVLTGMVGLVLLIASANVANLLLARASTRRREIALRLSLGASRARLVGQLVVESLILCLLGGLVGFWVSSLVASALIGILPGTPGVLSPDPGLRVALFAGMLSLLTGLFAVLPALRSTNPALYPILKDEGGTVMAASEPLRLRKGLVVAQVALSLLLLVGAGLFARSLHNLRSLNPGFDPRDLLTFSVAPSLLGYDDPGTIGVVTQIQEGLQARGDVRGAAAASVSLMTGSDESGTVKVEGYTPRDLENMNPNFNHVTPGFFRTLGISLLRGRDFTPDDTAGAPKVAVVNETFARYFYGQQDPVGRKFALGGEPQVPITIVGLVRDGKSMNLKEPPLRYVYQPIAQSKRLMRVTFYVRPRGSLGGLLPEARRAVAEASPNMPLADVRTMEDQLGESLGVERMTASLSAAFGLLATGLAALGLYGVISYTVSRRTREIGIRMAIGAERGKVVSLVIGEVLVLTLVGLLLGLPTAFLSGLALRSELFGLAPGDPVTVLGASLLLLTVSLAAGALPALRASRVDPVVALRSE
jgi:predicted permease